VPRNCAFRAQNRGDCILLLKSRIRAEFFRFNFSTGKYLFAEELSATKITIINSSLRNTFTLEHQIPAANS
jgi:hypothetical protein